ncbi:phosphate ABC transporter permease PstA [Haloplanus aerogenes]|uniref:Phosphate transport system permease protein PstA n=1 Tax=Haloplanus aerogenes TaxID=660522 RepID=A0A3M0DPH5_9EURY|nr:phosphate ABC transporter permease PstA [Haloplanus aerogenes]AZH24594.1 phosphate ABC transporter permease PstA [Haloplanus aerogenes]RMB23748.1 phosphate ABC transporter membrane protein 2 (PhoT family) [Haloplanus aerogenes]
MSNVERTGLVTGESSLGDLVANVVIAVSLLGFLASWGTIFQWLDETGTYVGFQLFHLLGGSLFVLAAGLAFAGLGSYFDYVDSTPSDSAGLTVGAIFGLLWAIVGGLAAAQWGGNALVVWGSGAVAFGLLGCVAAIYPREDLGSTLPIALLLGLIGYVIVSGHINAGWTWTPGWTGAEFPGSELVPVLVIHGALLGLWSAAKARRGYGAQGRQHGAYWLVGLTVFSMLGVLALLIMFIIVQGLDVMLTGASLTGGQVRLFGVTLPWIEVPFVTNVPGGLFVDIPGVMPAIVGTLWLVLGAVTFAVPLGVGAAIFLTEYAEQGRFTQLVEVATNGLWSTPSIVFGLFGLAFLVPRISGGNSIFVGQLVLGFMLLPLVLITSREAIKAVPDEYRDASAALGVTKWETIRSVVVPAAMPGVITGVILGVGRIAGETAPLLLVFGGSPFPSAGPQVLQSFRFSTTPPFVTNEALLSPASALPYQLYSSITAGVFDHPAFSSTEYGWGTALVLLLLVIGLYAVGVGSRIYFRRKLHHE